MKKVAIIFFILTIFSLSIIAQQSTKELDAELQKIAERGNLPGIGVAIVSKDEILFQKGYGYADIKNKKPYTKNTIQNIGSVSKTFIGIALMKAVEQGKIGLDDKVNDILPFKIINPHFPKAEIRVRHLATQTSTITDGDNYEKAYVFEKKIDSKGYPEEYAKVIDSYNSNKEIPLADFIKNITTENGKWYSKDNFLKTTPGAKYEYSNLGSAIAAYVLEIKTGETFDDYTRKHILEPLGMKNSGWTTESVDMKNHAVGYLLDMKPIPNYSLITYADGGFRTNIVDLSKYLMEVIKGLNGEGKILSKDSYQEMVSKQSKLIDTEYSIFWGYRRSGFIGHTGGDPGTTTILDFDPKTNRGVMVFTNYLIDSKDSQRQFIETYQTLVKYMKSLKNQD